MPHQKLANQWVIIILALIFFVPFLGKVHLFDWDEINFAESAREMLVSGNYLRVQIDFQPFWEKPPLFFWLQVVSMKIFGINEFAARFPNVVAGIITLLSFFYIGKKLINPSFGFLWALAYLGSVTPHLYFKSGIIDPWFNLFMFWSVVMMSDTILIKKNSIRSVFLAGLFAGLAVWTKGPVGVGVPTLTLGVFWGINRFKPIMSFKNLLVYFITAGALTVGWALTIIYESGWQTFVEFLKYLYRLGATSEADHGQPFYYHFVVVLIGCFPISIIGLKYLVTNSLKQNHSIFRMLMFCLFWVVMIVFSIVKTKIVHYSSMAYFPLSYIAALYLYNWLNSHEQWKRWQSILLVTIGFILSLALTAVPLIGMYAPVVSPYIDDKFVVANLQAPVEWRGYEWLIGVVYFIAIIFVISIWQKYKTMAVYSLFFSTALMLFCYTAMVVPNIEGYTQRTVIDFYESKQGQDVYVAPIGNRSYAQYFYFKKPMGVRPEASDENWLLNGNVDKSTFLIARIDRADEYFKHPNLELLKEENGFVFFKRR